jgi:Flp pilus assembly protein TadD
MNLYQTIPGRSLSYGLLVAAAAAVAIVGCATQPQQRAPARIEVQEEVGFTITEAGKISGDVRDGYQKALVLLEQERLDEGIEILEGVVERAPDLSTPHIDLGIAYHRAGDLEKAEAQLLAALQLNPNHPIAHNELGIIYRKTGRFADARASYEHALSVYPGFHYARRNLAVVCDLYLADLPCAIENYEAYMATVSGDDEAAMWLADARNRIGE